MSAGITRFAAVVLALGLTATHARGDPPAAPSVTPPVETPHPPPDASLSPSIGRYEVVQASGTAPAIMLDTLSGTTWILMPTGRPGEYGWARVNTMDASQIAAAEDDRRALRLHHRQPDADYVYTPPPPPGLR